jgi:hypothetical protein
VLLFGARPAAHAPVAAAASTPVRPTPSASGAATGALPSTGVATSIRPPVTVAAAAASVAPALPAAVPIERQSRCIEILQKASLEKVTPAETDFFKRECK